MLSSNKLLLSELKVGQKARVLRVKGQGPINRRILDIGLAPGSVVHVQKFAPLGDPMELKVKTFNLSLRKKEAAFIEVEVLADKVDNTA